MPNAVIDVAVIAGSDASEAALLLAADDDAVVDVGAGAASVETTSAEKDVLATGSECEQRASNDLGGFAAWRGLEGASDSVAGAARD